MAAGTAKRAHRLILLLRDDRRAQIAFQDVPLEGFLDALDAVLAINGLEFVWHLPYNFEDTDLRPDRLVFHRLTYRELVSHVPTFLIG
jgi:hypothetical protein